MPASAKRKQRTIGLSVRDGSGSLYQRGKTWWIAYYTPDGKQVCESAKTKDKTEARKTLQTKVGQIAEGRYVGPAAEKVTFEELAELIKTLIDESSAVNVLPSDLEH